MSKSQQKKAQRRLSNELINFWEAQYFVGTERIRRIAKQFAKKARRRLNKAILREESDDS